VNSVFNSASSFSGAVGSDLQIEPNDCDFSCILEYRPGQKELIHSNFCGQNTKIISLNIVVNKNKELNFNLPSIPKWGRFDPHIHPLKIKVKQ